MEIRGNFDSYVAPDYHCRPMSQRLPVFIDPYRLAETWRQFKGDVPLREMTRLVSLLARDQGDVQANIEFGVDDERVRYMKGHIHATLEMACQRCTRPMSIVIDRDFNLGLVASEVEAERLHSGYEPLIVEAKTMALAEILEDEIILALPMIATHAEGACEAAVGGGEPAPGVEEQPRKNPFAVLADLKKRSK